MNGRISRASLTIMLLLAPAAAAETGPVSVSEVVLKGEGYELPSTRVLPASPGPCVVFFAGSGPTDRDWLSPLMQGTNGSAAQLAAALAARGIGSLRFDKVGSGANMKHLEVLSLDHYVDEAILAFEHLRTTGRCTRVSLLGNSEGALHVLRAGARLVEDDGFGGVVTMSGGGRPLLEVLLEQIRDQYAAAGVDPATITPTLDSFRTAILALPERPTETPDLSAVPSLRMVWGQAVDPVQGRVVRELLQADPTTAAKAYTGPALVMSADHDIQVPVADGDLLFAALGSEQKSRVIVTDANHVYKIEKRPPDRSQVAVLARAYAEEGRELAPGTVEAIVEFLESIP